MFYSSFESTVLGAGRAPNRSCVVACMFPVLCTSFVAVQIMTMISVWRWCISSQLSLRLANSRQKRSSVVHVIVWAFSGAMCICASVRIMTMVAAGRWHISIQLILRLANGRWRVWQHCVCRFLVRTMIMVGAQDLAKQ